ncbi:receptor-like protein kinase ANXUR1 [Miscanthus floridulus]|uniref:receptor-like protein kinase ANXUR1 n=1 Tax=Miscanthus floridulus TaxID=154761 RepID=UPI0034581BD0
MAACRRDALLAVIIAINAVTLASAAKYMPPESILVDCGSAKEGQDADGRKWVTDQGGNWLIDGGKSSIMADADVQDPSLPSPVPYMSARVFTKEAVYNFSIGKDRHWLRLHFYPAAYHGVPAEQFFFSVSTSTGITLLRNFSVYITAKALSQAYIIREFTLPPMTDGTLSLTFTPTAMNNASYAFVNGIEIISMPDIFADPATMVGLSDQTVDTAASSLQTMYRLNVGGSYIAPTNDSGLSRDWYDDTPYLYGAAVGVTYKADDKVQIKFSSPEAEHAAPTSLYLSSRSMGPNPKVNQNYNLTWVFEVDSNFTYIVRLHFCELLLTKVNQRAFDIYINNKTAQADADVIGWTSEKDVPVYKDYATFMPDSPGDKILWIALHPSVSMKPEFYDAVLNGLEIFKMSDSSGNLAGPNPDPSRMLEEAEMDVTTGKFKAKPSNLRAMVIGGAAGGAAAFGIVAAICIVAYHSKKRRVLGNSVSHSSGWLPVYGGNSHTNASKSSGGKSAALNPNITAMCRHFSFQEIKAATKNFDESLVIGVGGFGKVYRGIVDGDTKVAIKRSNPSSEQGVLEFQTEIEMLSKLRHKHLVSLIGCCEDDGEMILVYDYMAHGTLREHLYKSGKPALSWRQRLEITIGAARGLHYLHTGAKYTIIHRDVKTTNILVDENWVAKVSDFGLSKTGPTAMNQTHVSTMVKGSFGYLDPEYFRRQQLTEKSDVYSYGVVLFEVLCARPALNPSLPREQVSLADHALSCQRKGTLQDIIDPLLKGKIAPDCLKKYAETAEKCLADHGVDRPSMGDVLWNLEFALQMQDTFENGEKPEGGGSMSNSSTVSMADSMAASAAALELISEDMDEEDIANSVVFSQLVHPTGR